MGKRFGGIVLAGAILFFGGVGSNDVYALTAPSIIIQPVNVTVAAPSKAIFKVTANGTPAPKYQWMQSVNGGAFTNVIGATSASFTTPATIVANNGTQYECVITNVAGSVTSNIVTLTVNLKPSISTQPTSLTVISPATAIFAVIASGAPTPTYQWQQEEPGASAYTAISGATSASFTTPATTASNSGTKYKCVVSNVAGSVTSNAATLTVYLMPSITTQPINALVKAPAKATFTVAATGAPTPRYQWMQSVNGGVFTAISGATKASYTTAATKVVNSGTQFECVITNAAGTITSNAATLIVNPVAPSITTQPVSVAVIAPAPVTFTVAAIGTPPPTYQWMIAPSGISTFTVVPGITSASFTIPTTQAFYSGARIECIVSNVVGSVTSNVVTLTVSQPAPLVDITSPANNSTLVAGSSMTITASASEASYGIINSVSFYNGLTLLGTITRVPYSYPVTNVSVGTYTLTATATDTNNVSTTSSPITVTVNGQPTINIVNPDNQSTFTTGSINITAIAKENYGTIRNVAFYNGATLLGNVTSTSQAFTYSWTNVPAGTYNLTAVATDIMGTTATSFPITVTINASPFTFAVDDNIASKKDVLNRTTSYQYDNLNRLLKTTFTDESTVSEAYDLFGNQISVTDQRGNVLIKTYDAYERLSQTKNPLGGITQYNYDTEGHLVTLKDANGHATIYTYDPNGKLLTKTNALNYSTVFTYDPAGNAATRTDADSKATNYTYDVLNRLTNTTYPDGTSIVNVYDAIGRKTSMTDATGQTTYTYDPLNRLLTKTSPGTNNSIIYTYDSEGNRLTSVDQNNRTITNVYDALNRLVSVTDSNGTTSYGYDAVSNKILVKSPNGVAENYTYDPLNRLLSVVNTSSSGGISSFSNIYDVAGMITKKTLQDGTWTVYSYDPLNRLLEETKQTSGSTIYDNVFTYDAVGNRLTWTKNTTSGNFWSVDSINMPTQVLANMTSGGYGNTATPSQSMNLVRNYTYDVANRLTNWNYTVNVSSSSYPVQTNTYTYDQNGNRLTKQAVLTGQETTPQQTTYGYDFENRLNQLQYVNVPSITGAQTDSLIYNGEGLRTQAIMNSVAANYLYDGANVLGERDGSGNTTKTYTRGLDIGGGIGSLISQNYTANSTAVTQYYDYNDLGSTSDLTTPTGTSTTSYSYDAFGNLLTPQANSDTNRYLFSSKEFDSRSGLHYFGGRYYDPEVGRWLTPDPLGFAGGQVNLYVYVNNNPENIIDPYGLCGETAQSEALQSDDLTSLGLGAAITGIAAGGWAAYEAYLEAQQIANVGWWQYYPADNPNYQSPWITQGTKITPPYAVGQEAREALNLPPWNDGSAVRPVEVNPNEPIAGPQTPKSQPQWNWPNPGNGKEWYRGKEFPNGGN